GFFLVDPINVDDSMRQKIFDQYEKDWKEWPGDKGAPYLDTDNNNKYDPEIDIPGVPSAPQTIWISYNDDSSETLYAVPPTGIETQETYWAYNYAGTAGNIAFKRVKLIYNGLPSSSKSSYIEKMYITQWADPDIYSSSDDFVGCDTLLNLGYAYDARFQGFYYLNPHFDLKYLTAGYTILQAPAYKTDNFSDSAVIDFRWCRGYKSAVPKPMSSFVYYAPGGDYIEYDPVWGLYNQMMGLNRYGTPFPDTIAERSTYGTYLLPGDPVSGTGKIDGYYDPPSDRRILIVTGPFNMQLRDTVEVVIALVGGFGTDNLNCITELRRNVQTAELIYYSLVDSITNEKISAPIRKKEPGQYVLYQNYPNPFNSSTIIKYRLPEPAHVKLVIYDILGGIVKVLVNESKAAGNHQVEFNSAGLASGIYIYRISFDNTSSRLVYDNLTKSCKLIVIK
ncbi:MAG: T9SS type A sorting domain-containing protein, partial [Ignavibacteria bacterium]